MGLLKYNGYSGSVEYEEDENYFYGKVLGLWRHCILYEGDSIDELIKDFHESIDHYLETCRLEGITPDRPYSGKVILRMSSDLHGEVAAKAASAGISLNEFINRAIQMAVR